MASFQIRDLERHDARAGDHYWTARVVSGAVSIDVDSRDGSWLVRAGNGIREVALEVAAALQAKVRPLERRERATA